MKEKKSQWAKPQLIHLDPYGGASGVNKEIQGGSVHVRLGGTTMGGGNATAAQVSNYLNPTTANSLANTAITTSRFNAAAPAS